MYTVTQNQQINIFNAKKILERNSMEADFIGYSDTNGVSVYFRDENDIKIRVSDHSVTNASRVQNEKHFSFDRRTITAEMLKSM